MQEVLTLLKHTQAGSGDTTTTLEDNLRKSLQILQEEKSEKKAAKHDNNEFNKL